MKNLSDPTGNWIHNFLACSTVPQQTASCKTFSMTAIKKMHTLYPSSFIFVFPQLHRIPKQLKLNHCFWSEPPSVNHLAATIQAKDVWFYILMVIWNNWNKHQRCSFIICLHTKVPNMKGIIRHIPPSRIRRGFKLVSHHRTIMCLEVIFSSSGWNTTPTK